MGSLRPCRIPGHLIAEAASAFRLDPDEPRALLLAAVTQPAESGDDVIARIRDRVSVDPDDALGAWYLGYALNLCGEIEPAADYLQQAVDGFRAQRQPRPAAARADGAVLDLLPARTVRAGPGAIDECMTIAIDVEDPGLGAAARVALAWYDAIDGTPPDREAIAGSSPFAALVARITISSRDARVRGGRRRAGDRSAARCRTPAQPARRCGATSVYNLMFRIMSLPDLVEAAVLAGHRSHSRGRRSAAIAGIHEGWHAPVLGAVLAYARIALADDALLDEASEAIDATRLPMPFLQARAHLLIGSRLRRLRRTADSRHHLHSALDAVRGVPGGEVGGAHTRGAARLRRAASRRRALRQPRPDAAGAADVRSWRPAASAIARSPSDCSCRRGRWRASLHRVPQARDHRPGAAGRRARAPVSRSAAVAAPTMRGLRASAAQRQRAHPSRGSRARSERLRPTHDRSSASGRGSG